MSTKLEKLQFVIGLIDKISNPIARIQQRLSGLMRLGTKVGGTLSGVGLGVGLASATKVSASYEDLGAVLETLEGSSTKAQESLKWIKDFTKTTPYELQQTSEAFARLKAYGIDPTKGTMRILGDTSAAMGKDIMASVDMIADAIVGENERLKEFGIRGSSIKGTDFLEYGYKDKLGLQQTVRVNKNDQTAILQTLEKIFSDKYAGAMEKRSKTFNGILANMKDTLSGLQSQFMDAGLFDLMKSNLQGKLDMLNRLSESGAVERWGARAVTGAKLLGTGIDTVTKRISAANTQLNAFVGGWGNLGRIFGLVKLPAAVTNSSVPEWLRSKPLSAGAISPLLDQTYQVTKGDNLWNLAKHYKGKGIQYTQLAELNALANPDHLAVGQQLTIAKAKTSVLPEWAKTPSSQAVNTLSPVTNLTTTQPAPLTNIADLAKSNKVLASAILLRQAYETTSTKVTQSLERISTSAKANFGKVLDWGLAHSEQLSQTSKIASSLVIGYFSRIPNLVGMAYRGGAKFSSYLLATAQHELPAFKQQVGSVFTTIGIWAETNSNKIKAAFSPAISGLLQRTNIYLSKLSNAAESGQLGLWLDKLLSKAQPATLALIDFGEGVSSVFATISAFIVRMSAFVGGWGNLGKIFAGLVVVTVLGSTLAAMAALLQILFVSGQILWATSAALMMLARSALAAKIATWLYKGALIALRAISLVGMLAAMTVSLLATTTAASAASAATWLFNAALAVLTSPITLVLAALAALAAGAYYLYNHWSQVKAYLAETSWGQALLNMIHAVLHPLDSFNFAINWLETQWTNTKNALAETTWGQMILGAINALFSPFETFKVSINAAKLVWENIKNSLSDTSWGQAIISTIDRILGFIGKFKEGWASLKSAASEKISGAWGSMKASIGFGDEPTSAGGRAVGGLIRAGIPYRINERVPEVMIQGSKTWVLNDQAARIMPLAPLNAANNNMASVTRLTDRLANNRVTHSTANNNMASVTHLTDRLVDQRLTQNTASNNSMATVTHLTDRLADQRLPQNTANNNSMASVTRLTDRLANNRVTHSTANNNMASVTRLTDRLTDTRITNNTVNDPTEDISARVNESQSPLREIVQGRSPTPTVGLRNLINNSVSNRERLLMQNKGEKRIQIGTVHLHINGDVDAERLIHELEMAS